MLVSRTSLLSDRSFSHPDPLVLFDIIYPHGVVVRQAALNYDCKERFEARWKG